MNTQNQTTYPVSIPTRFGPVKIYKTHTQQWDEYVVSWHLAGNRRREKFADEARAQARADEIARDVNKAEFDRASLSTSELAEYRAAKQLIGKGSLITAAQFFAKFNREEESVTVEQVGEHFLREIELTNKSSRHLSTSKSLINSINAKFANRLIRDVTRDDLLQFVSSVKLSAKSRNNIIRTLRSLWKHAQSKMSAIPYGVPHAASTLPRIADTEQGAEQIVIYSPEDFEKLLRTGEMEFKAHRLPDWVLTWIAIGGFTGMRSAEIGRLNWEQIRLDEKHILLDRFQTKTKRRRLIPICPSLTEWLLRLRPENASGRVCLGPIYTWTKQVAKAAFGSESAWKHNGLRHSYISYAMAEIGDPYKVAEICGNSAAMVKTEYQKLALPSDASKYFGIRPLHLEAKKTLDAA
jgi:integrase